MFAFMCGQIIRYLMVGGTAALAQMLSLIGLVQLLTVSPVFANMLAYVLGFLLTFLGHCYWTFSHHSSLRTFLFLRYMLVGVLNFFLNQLSFYFFYEALNLHYVIALGISIVCVTMITFILNKFFVFVC